MDTDLTSMEMRRWLVVGIFLHNVLIPSLREKVNKVMPEYYKRMTERYQLDRQTFCQYKERLGGVKVNYESINNNKDIKCPNPSSQYDYRVKDPVSLAKLFMEPRMAKFITFDDEFETSATLAVLAGVEEFEGDVRSVARSLNAVVRVPWAHPIFRVWTEEKYEECFWTMKLLVNRFFQSEDQKLKGILDKLKFWKTQGLEICLGNLSDDVMYNNLRKEVDALQDMMTKNQETTGVETKRIRLALDLLTNGVHKAMSKLHDKQSHLEEIFLEMEKKFEERFSHFEKSVHQRIDGLDGKLAKLSGSVKKLMEITENFNNPQFGKQSSSELSYIRQFTQEEKHLQPNEELASAALELGQQTALDELDTVKKNKPKGKKKRNKTRS